MKEEEDLTLSELMKMQKEQQKKNKKMQQELTSEKAKKIADLEKQEEKSKENLTKKVNDFYHKELQKDNLEKKKQKEIQKQKEIERLNFIKVKQEALDNLKNNTTTPTTIKQENNVSLLLKVGSVILFFLCVIASGTISYQEKIVEEDKIQITREFNGGLAFGLISASAISCSLIYAFGELIQIQDDNKHLLEQIVKNTEK
ncbi:MAG: hypothetical protein ACLTT4_16280 [Coprobacillus cateniformis]|jgi:hypothetical protein|nr:MAG TPA: hypothetical protein [Caudoviricetes sp.]